MKHLLVYSILPQPCTHEDLEEFNPELDPAPSIGPLGVNLEKATPVRHVRKIHRFQEKSLQSTSRQ